MNISAVVKDLAASQSSFYMIKEFNKFLNNPDISAGAFYQRASIPVTPPCFGVKICAHLSSYKGVLIPTTLELANMCLNFKINTDIYLYLWDMEWLDTPLHFGPAMEILRNKNINILARSESHADCIESFCNKRPIGIVDNWDIDTILNIVN